MGFAPGGPLPYGCYMGPFPHVARACHYPWLCCIFDHNIGSDGLAAYPTFYLRFTVFGALYARKRVFAPISLRKLYRESTPRSAGFPKSPLHLESRRTIRVFSYLLRICSMPARFTLAVIERTISPEGTSLLLRPYTLGHSIPLDY